MKLGVDTYSLRSLDWGAFEHLDYAHAMGLDAVQFSERNYFDSLEEEHLTAVKSKRVLVPQSDALSIAGPGFIDGIEDLARWLYPDLFD